MTPEQFVYFLLGYSEISGQPPTDEQWDTIKNQLIFLIRKLEERQMSSIKPNDPQSFDVMSMADNIRSQVFRNHENL